MATTSHPDLEQVGGTDGWYGLPAELLEFDGPNVLWQLGRLVARRQESTPALRAAKA